MDGLTSKNSDIFIVDDGTMDTVVECAGEWIRYSSEYRFSFDNDETFLEAIREEVEEWVRFEARAWPYHNDGKERGGWRSIYLKKERDND